MGRSVRSDGGRRSSHERCSRHRFPSTGSPINAPAMRPRIIVDGSGTEVVLALTQLVMVLESSVTAPFAPERFRQGWSRRWSS